MASGYPRSRARRKRLRMVCSPVGRSGQISVVVVENSPMMPGNKGSKVWRPTPGRRSDPTEPDFSMSTLVVGFDSAWTQTSTGAIVGALVDETGAVHELGLPHRAGSRLDACQNWDDRTTIGENRQSSLGESQACTVPGVLDTG